MNVREVVTRSAITGAVGAAAFFAVDGLRKAFTSTDKALQASRVVHYNESYIVAVRGMSGEWHDVREFVQPADWQVQNVYQRIGDDPWECYRYVCENISYEMERLEYWRWPSETLTRMKGDCEDTSFVLASLLRNFSSDAWVVVGRYINYGHAWVETGGQIMETTLTAPVAIGDVANYQPYFYFNDELAVEMWPGALSEILSTRPNTFKKLRVIGS